MVYALYYQNKLVYKRACRDLKTFKIRLYARRQELFKSVQYIDWNNNFNKLFNCKYRCIVEGWEIREYKNYKQVLSTIQTDFHKRKGRQKEANNFFYVFDTESTNYRNKYAFTYLYGIRKYNYDYNINDDNIEDYAGAYIYFNGIGAVEQFSNYLKSINEQAEKENKLTYIYVHNLIYDLYELLQNIFINFDISEDDIKNNINDSIFRGQATKPLRFRFKNLVFIDSLALTNKSLAKISQNHKIKKQQELKTYKEQYFFGSELPESELIYNKYDLDVTALGIMDSIRSLKTEFKTFNDYVKTYVTTVTGVSRYLNKHIYTDNKRNKAILNEHTARASNNLPIDENGQIDVNTLVFWQEVFQGGFTHCNPFFAYNVLLAIDERYTYISYDKKSHYPSTMTMRFFPYKFKEVKEDKTKLLKEWNKENLEAIEFFKTDEFINNMLSAKQRFKNGQIIRDYFSPCKHYFICELELKNLKIKFFDNNFMPLIAFSKTGFKNSDILSHNITVDNGKILRAERITIKCTNIDLLSYYMMYEFDIVKCTKLYYTSISKFADSYIQDTLRYHLVNKNELDNCIKGKKDITELENFSGDKLFNQITIDNFKQMTKQEQEEFLNTEYQATKTNGINNQYGINVQRIVNDNIIFNLDSFTFQKEINVIQGCKGRQTTRDYITGVYITAYARLDLALMTYIIYNRMENAQVVYWDTDSLKIRIKKEERQELDSLFEWYNKKLEKIRDKAVEYNGNLFNLGIWELDGEYKYFYSLGAKKYVVCAYDKKLKKDVIKVTNSGINKKIFSEKLTEVFDIFKKYHNSADSFKLMLAKCYHPNIALGTDVTGRKTIEYPKIHDDKIKIKVKDENGEIKNINQYPTAIITDCDYNLNNMRGLHVLNRMHYQLCRKLQELNGLKFECNTDFNYFGKISKIYNDENSNFILT